MQKEGCIIIIKIFMMNNKILSVLVMVIFTTLGCSQQERLPVTQGTAIVVFEDLSLSRLSTTNDGGRIWYTYVLKDKNTWIERREDLKVALRRFLEQERRTANRGTLGLGIAIYISEVEARERLHKIALYSDSGETIHYDTVYIDKVDEFVFPEVPKMNSELHFDSTINDLVFHLKQCGIECRYEGGLNSGSLHGYGFEATLRAAKNQFFLHKLTQDLERNEAVFWQNGRFFLSLEPRLMHNLERRGYFETKKLRDKIVNAFFSFGNTNKELKAKR